MQNNAKSYLNRYPQWCRFDYMDDFNEKFKSQVVTSLNVFKRMFSFENSVIQDVCYETNCFYDDEAKK